MVKKMFLVQVLLLSKLLTAEESKAVPIIEKDFSNSTQPQVINNYYTAPNIEPERSLADLNHSFSFNLGASEFIGLEYGYFATDNFEISLGLGVIPFGEADPSDLDTQSCEDLSCATDGPLPLVNLKFTYYLNINDNNKFYFGAVGTYIFIPGVFAGYEAISDGGFFFKLGAYLWLPQITNNWIYPIPGLAIGSRF